MTWPLAAVMHREIASDLGDPLFNCWILAWTGGTVLRFLGGDVSALSQYWHGNIFYPAPLATAFSEHLTPLMLQTLPVFAVTHNVVLCYNLLLLGTVVLSGLGMYLLVRELTGEPVAAAFAGLAFAFAPYRLDQFSHIEVLSSEWMPFVFFGFRRFFATGRRWPLAGAVAALAAQALSCGYYLAYFTPLAVAYGLYEMATRGLLRDRRAWLSLIIAGLVALTIVLPFLRPYFAVRASTNLGVRHERSVQQFSADTWGFATISSHSRLLGDRVGALPRNENQGFPGFTILAFALVGVGAGFTRARRRSRQAADAPAPARQIAAGCSATLAIAAAYVLGHLVVTGDFVFSAGELFFSTHRVGAELQLLAVALLGLWFASPGLRRLVRGTPQSTMAFFACGTMYAAWMSLGPHMFANEKPIGPGLYELFYRWVPGFNGLRVSSLHFMIVALCLAALAGLGAAALLARARRTGTIVLVVAAVALLAEVWSVPVARNLRLDADGLAPTPSEIGIGRTVSPLYTFIRDLPAGVVLIELPYGASAYEIQYTFYAGYHRKPLVNGYSGFYPEEYLRRIGPLSDMSGSAEGGWQTLLGSGATHVIVHEAAFTGDRGRDVSDWLRRHGAREVAAAGADRLFEIR
jgi:hypothetical protein